VSLAALSPKPTETGPDHRTGLCILAANEIAIIESPQGSTNKKIELSLFPPAEVAAAEIWEQGQRRGCRCLRVLGQLPLFFVCFGIFSKTEVEVSVWGPYVDLNK